MTMRPMEGLGSQVVSILLNGISVIFAKLALFGLSQWEFLAVYGCASLLLAAPFVNIGKIPVFLRSYAGLLAVAVGTGGVVLFYLGLDALDPATHSFVVRGYVIYGLLISWFVLGERLRRASAIIAGICAVGTLLAAWPETSELRHWVAVSTTSLAALLFACNYAALRHLSDRAGAAIPIALTNGCIILALAVSDRSVFVSARDADVYSVLMAVLSAASLAASTYFFMVGAKRLPFWLSTSIRAASPLVVLLFSLPFFVTNLSFINLLGYFVVVVSVFYLGLTQSGKGSA